MTDFEACSEKRPREGRTVSWGINVHATFLEALGGTLNRISIHEHGPVPFGHVEQRHAVHPFVLDAVDLLQAQARVPWERDAPEHDGNVFGPAHLHVAAHAGHFRMAWDGRQLGRDADRLPEG